MADMAVQCFAGNAARGMSLVALHNGGGVGIGKAINGGFGMVLDGSERVDRDPSFSHALGCDGRVPAVHGPVIPMPCRPVPPLMTAMAIGIISHCLLSRKEI